VSRSKATWFLDNKIRVFPIKQAGIALADGSVTKGKEPDCRSWDDYNCGRSVAAKFVNYGVILGLLGVVDSDDPETELWVINNIPPTPFIVNTARGKHRYFRLINDAPHFFHREGHTIEFRHRGQYVVGPGSLHASGFTYHANDWSWDIREIPIFPVKDFHWDDRSADERGGSSELGAAFVLPSRIHAGERHDLMFRLMRSLQARGIEDVNQLLVVLKQENLAKCQPPIPESELETYIRRVSKHPDRKEFKRLEVVDLSLAINLTEVGLSPDAIKSASGVDLLARAEHIPDYATFEEPADDPDYTPPISDPVLSEAIAVDSPAVSSSNVLTFHTTLKSKKPSKKRTPKTPLTLEQQLAKQEERIEMLKNGMNDDDLELVDDDSEDNLEVVEVDNVDDY
jgi:hypothetical protein